MPCPTQTRPRSHQGRRPPLVGESRRLVIVIRKRGDVARADRVEELSEKVAEKDSRSRVPDQVSAGVGQLDEMRLRSDAKSRRTSTARRDILSSCSKSSTTSSAPSTRRDVAVGETLLQGVEMVRRQFLSKLEGRGTPIESTDARFNPALHEAISTVPAASPDQDRRSSASSQGYRIGDDVLGRPRSPSPSHNSPAAVPRRPRRALPTKPALSATINPCRSSNTSVRTAGGSSRHS